MRKWLLFRLAKWILAVDGVVSRVLYSAWTYWESQEITLALYDAVVFVARGYQCEFCERKAYLNGLCVHCYEEE